MFYRTTDIDEMFTENDANHEIIDIMSNNGTNLKLVYVRKNEGFDSHMSDTNVFIYIIDGEIELSFSKDIVCGCNICGAQMPDSNDNEKKEYKVKKGQFFIFEKDVSHSLKANKDTKFFMVKM